MHTSTHETRGVLYWHICSSCFTKMAKPFPMKGKYKTKRVSMGVGYHIGSVFHKRFLGNSTYNNTYYFDQELCADKQDYGKWFHTKKLLPLHMMDGFTPKLTLKNYSIQTVNMLTKI